MVPLHRQRECSTQSRLFPLVPCNNICYHPVQIEPWHTVTNFISTKLDCWSLLIYRQHSYYEIKAHSKIVKRRGRKAWDSVSKASQTKEDEGRSALHTALRHANCIYGGRNGKLQQAIITVNCLGHSFYSDAVLSSRAELEREHLPHVAVRAEHLNICSWAKLARYTFCVTHRNYSRHFL